MCGTVSQNIYAPSGGVSRVATFNDDGDNSGDEAQNYFAGGDRRHVSSDLHFLTLTKGAFAFSAG